MDLVGPRYLKGSARLYCLNILDTSTHWAHIHPMLSKQSGDILGGIIEFWRQVGVPDCLQMDNELVFRGSNKHPRSLGLILRFALAMGVTVRFIPVAEPWRNGTVERFNQTFDKIFFRAQTFADYEAFSAEAKIFEDFHNQNHRYSSQGGHTPMRMQLLHKPGGLLRLPDGFDPARPMRLEEGRISFVRFIRSDLKLSVLGTTFIVSKMLAYSYVEADIFVEHHTLLVIAGNNVYHRFPFTMPVDWTMGA